MMTSTSPATRAFKASPARISRGCFAMLVWPGAHMPLGWVGFAMHHAGFGLNASTYHLANTIIHGACAVLLFYILSNILGRVVGAQQSRGQMSISLCAALGTLIWAVHPLRTEVVAWASGRLYLQATLLLL